MLKYLFFTEEIDMFVAQLTKGSFGFLQTCRAGS